MSTTDQFPPRHLLPEEEEEGEQGKTQQSHKGNDAPTATTSQGTHDEETSKQPQLALPAPSSFTNGASSTPNDDPSRSLNVATGNRVALDELGPMVVNPNGTLSRIHNWSEMIPSERERTLRVLGARNKLRMDSIRGQEGEGEQGDK